MKLFEIYNGRGFPSSQIDSESEIIEWCKKNATNYFKNPVPIYRGDSNGKTGIYHTDKLFRLSRNTYNYYNLWMDNHPKWQEYPKRSKSLICTTSIITAEINNPNVFTVIPSDKCKIGVSNHQDIWTSFESLRLFFRTGGAGRRTSETMDNLVVKLHSMLSFSSTDNEDYEMNEGPLQRDWPTLKSALKEITQDLILDNVSEHRGDWPVAKLRGFTILARKMERMGFENLYEVLDALMDPSMNKFRVATPSTIPAESDVELWIGNGDVLLIQNDTNTKLIDEIAKKL